MCEYDDGIGWFGCGVYGIYFGILEWHIEHYRDA
jgi:hypothetical protein